MKTKQNRLIKGFSLVEMMVVVAVMGFVMGSIYTAMIHFRNQSGMEQLRMRQSQETRFLMSTFATEFRNAGAVLSIASSKGMLGKNSYFTGILPLNNADYPDGVILATGDPTMVFKLKEPASGSATTFMVTTKVQNPVWNQNDMAILLGERGFCIYRVNSGTATSIEVASPPVYYSGMLNTPLHYIDKAFVLMGSNGFNETYPADAPLIRLSGFSIYLIKESYDSRQRRTVRQLFRVTDTKGIPDVFNNETVEKSLVAENIYDMQIVYHSFTGNRLENQTDYFTRTPPNQSDDYLQLLADMNSKAFKEVTIFVVTISDELPSKGITSILRTRIQPFADLLDPYLISGRKMSVRQFSFKIAPKNFGLVVI